MHSDKVWGPKETDTLTERIISAAMEVHTIVGPGLLESTYEDSLAYELTGRKMRFKRQVSLPLKYKALTIPGAYRLDLLVEDEVVVEIKAVEKVLGLHYAQVRTYLQHSGFIRGLLINFNSVPLRNGIRRINIDDVSPSPRLPVSP